MGYALSSDFEASLTGRRVLVTGHSGFAGGWLVVWLRAIGCDVFGLALPPTTRPNLFTAAGIAEQMRSQFADVRDAAVVARAIADIQPDVIFHLAAQALVSRGFAEPLETLETNVMGTAHVLEAARSVPAVKAVVCITTDKVYADREWSWAYRENDALGGKDPYSASKACAELVASCYAATLATRGNGCLIATARGGNIIGGGDWSEDRIVPDFVRAVVSGQPLRLRSPDAVRPWQHVLALVHGCVVLAARLLDVGALFAGGWNLGPPDRDAVPVATLVDMLAKAWARPQLASDRPSFPETHFLHLDSTRARTQLGWRPPLDVDRAVRLSGEWYRDYYAKPSAALELTMAQIDEYRRVIACEQ